MDLVILQQENGLAINYIIQVIGRLFGVKAAFFGHGRNFQSSRAGSLRENFKKFWISRVDWWFAYTDRSARVVAEAGFPSDRITVFNNAIDTAEIRAQVAKIDPLELVELRRNAFGNSENIGVYIGGLYDLKRIPFLIETAKLIRDRVPDFELLVIGGGPDLAVVQDAARLHPWIHALGPKFGPEKTRLASLGKVFLMPGLVGLGVLDSFAYGAPMVTTNVSYHSPEIDYLKDGENGVVVQDPENVSEYADAVVRVLRDDEFRARLRQGATEALATFTIEAMADRFSRGIIEALKRPPLRS